VVSYFDGSNKLQVSENKVFSKIFGPKKDEVMQAIFDVTK
jgi:hypothetical protein